LCGEFAIIQSWARRGGVRSSRDGKAARGRRMIGLKEKTQKYFRHRQEPDRLRPAFGIQGGIRFARWHIRAVRLIDDGPGRGRESRGPKGSSCRLVFAGRLGQNHAFGNGPANVGRLECPPAAVIVHGADGSGGLARTRFWVWGQRCGEGRFSRAPSDTGWWGQKMPM